MRRDGEREFVARKQDAAALLVRKLEMLLELRERGDAIFELPFPVIPEFGRHIGPITRRMRDELFSILFALGKSDHFVLWERNVNGLNNRVNAGTFWCATHVLVPRFWSYSCSCLERPAAI